MAHLSGEHREIHAVWNIIYKNKKGYSKHPETLRWRGKLDALKMRHDMIVSEMKTRMTRKKKHYNHKTELPWVGDRRTQDVLVDSVQSQMDNIKAKNCECLGDGE